MHDLIHIGGLHMFSRDSGGGLVLAAYHPRKHSTWHWSVSVRKMPGKPHRARQRYGQWHDYYWLPFGRLLVVGQQDFHKSPRQNA